MDIAKWIMIGCLIAILAPLFGVSVAFLMGRILLGKEQEKSLPTDGAKIKMSQLDSKSDLKDLIDDSERFRIKHNE